VVGRVCVWGGGDEGFVGGGGYIFCCPNTLYTHTHTHTLFTPSWQLTLEPYERDHAVVIGIYRAPATKK
jgi:hypothetical protein